MSTAPSVIGRFHVRKWLGEGAMGVLYLAQDPDIDRLVAIKLLRLDGDAVRERLLREARLAARLQHPNIVTIYDVGQHEQRPFIAMEYVEGETLAQLIRRRAPLTLAQKLAILVDACTGLGYAHAHDIVHRDVKPANLMVAAENHTLKVLDFGIAHGTDATLTPAGMLVGTPSYMSPEQIAGLPIDHRADIFALGLVAYELLTGKHAFGTARTATTGEVLRRIKEEAPTPLEEHDPGLDPALVAIVDRAMDKDRDQRYQTCDEMKADLLALEERARLATSVVGMEAGRPSRSSTRSRRWPLMVAAAIFLAITSLIVAGVALRARERVAQAKPTPLPPPAPSVVMSPAPAPTPADRPAEAPKKTVPDVARPRLSAKSLFYGRTNTIKLAESTTGVPRNTGLRFKILQQTESGREVEVDPDMAFHSGDHVRFAFESNLDGYLYVVSKGSSGRWTVLFPHPDVNAGQNAITAFRDYVVPSDAWFVFNATPGIEEVFVLLSKEPLKQLSSLAVPVTKTETLAQSTVQEIAGMVQSRDLVVEKMQSTGPTGSTNTPRTDQGTFVVNRAALGQAVAATVRLIHK